jgi:putative ABC transport system permease protein
LSAIWRRNCRWSAPSGFDIVAQVKALLNPDGAVRIATGFAILMGMIVLAGSVVATRRQRARDIVLLRLVAQRAAKWPEAS